jgi:hypothetical protein
MPCKFVQQDRDTVDAAAALEVRLYFLGRGAVVNVAYEDASRVDVFPVLAQIAALLVEVLLHLAQLVGLVFHLSHTLLHLVDFALFVLE